MTRFLRLLRLHVPSVETALTLRFFQPGSGVGIIGARLDDRLKTTARLVPVLHPKGGQSFGEELFQALLQFFIDLWRRLRRALPYTLRFRQTGR